MLQKLINAHNRDLDAAVLNGRPLACAQTCHFFFPPENGKDPANTVRYTRNETIFAKGDKALYAYRIVQGAVRLSRMYADGRRQIVSFHSAGECFGLVLEARCPVTAEAVCETRLLRCPLSCVLHTPASDPEVNRIRLQLVCRDLGAARRHVAMLGHLNARRRIATFFLSLQSSPQHSDALAVDLPLGRQDIADYLGLTIETTCRAMSELKRRRIIDTPSRRMVVIRDPQTLAAIAEGLAA